MTAVQTKAATTNPVTNDSPIMNMSSVEESVAHIPRRRLGTIEYTPSKLLLLNHELDFNCLLNVFIPANHLQPARLTEIKEKRELFGTDVYTDDSDLVAVLHHQNKLPKFAKSVHDLSVDLLVLPNLYEYLGSTKNGLTSRTWTRHDGLSYKVNCVTELSTQTNFQLNDICFEL